MLSIQMIQWNLFLEFSCVPAMELSGIVFCITYSRGLLAVTVTVLTEGNIK